MKNPIKGWFSWNSPEKPKDNSIVQETMYTMKSDDKANVLLTPTNKMQFAIAGEKVAEIDVKHPYNITFHKKDSEGKDILLGTLDLSSGKLKFEGLLEPSAEVLFQLVKKLADKYIEEKTKKIKNLDEYLKGEMNNGTK